MNYDSLKLENQLCFPLYACSKEVIRRYKPYLDKIDLTYTQYIAMMVMWEKREVTVKELGSWKNYIERNWKSRPGIWSVFLSVSSEPYEKKKAVL